MNYHRTLLGPATLGLVAAVWAAGGAWAADSKHIRALESALELRFGAVRLPENLADSVIVTPCAGCVPLSLGLASDVSLQWNGKAISLQDLRQRALAGPSAPVVVIYARASGRIVRIIAND